MAWIYGQNFRNPIGLEKALLFFKSWTSECAYVFGLLIADGCLTTRRGLFWDVSLELKDIDHVKLVASVIDPKLRVHVYTRKDGRQSAKFTMKMTEIVDDCVALGLRPRKSFDVEWPSTLPAEFEADFVRGYFDGDGGITWSITRNSFGYASKRRCLDFACGSSNFAITLGEVIHRNTGIESNIRHLKNYSRPQYLSKDAIRAVGDWMYVASPLRLERKYQKWQETLLPWNKVVTPDLQQDDFALS
jgi:hypothetical protein